MRFCGWRFSLLPARDFVEPCEFGSSGVENPRSHPGGGTVSPPVFPSPSNQMSRLQFCCGMRFCGWRFSLLPAHDFVEPCEFGSSGVENPRSHPGGGTVSPPVLPSPSNQMSRLQFCCGMRFCGWRSSLLPAHDFVEPCEFGSSGVENPRFHPGGGTVSPPVFPSPSNQMSRLQFCCGMSFCGWRSSLLPARDFAEPCEFGSSGVENPRSRPGGGTVSPPVFPSPGHQMSRLQFCCGMRFCGWRSSLLPARDFVEPCEFGSSGVENPRSHPGGGTVSPPVFPSPGNQMSCLQFSCGMRFCGWRPSLLPARDFVEPCEFGSSGVENPRSWAVSLRR